MWLGHQRYRSHVVISMTFCVSKPSYRGVVCPLQRTDDLRGRDALEARDKVLGLIQQWGEEFLTRHNCTGTELFVQTYRELRVKGA
jgi:hypothetical protein